MNLVYAVDRKSFNDVNHVGVVKKVEAQIRVFEKNNIFTTMCQYDWIGGYPQLEVEEGIDVLYFRRIEPSLKFLSKLYQIKKLNSNMKIIMEIPTYPFMGEEKSSIAIKRRLNRTIGEKFLYKYIDRIVLIGSNEKELYGIPTICIKNGVDFEKERLRRIDKNNTFDNDIHMICVSGCYFWHGYDRVIEGLKQYYGKEEPVKRKVYFHVVGEGDCLAQYKELAQKYNLHEDVVKFYGRKIGEELDVIYDQCDIALECFANHRKDIYHSSSLKSKEYVAKGLPIATSIDLDICNKDTEKFIRMFPANEEPLDINEIIDFYDNIYQQRNKQEVAKEIREAFQQECDWKYTFADVIEYIKGEKK